MSEWWTYTLSDFLMFSPRTYYRLLVRHNAEVWPAQVAAAGAGVAIMALLRQGTPAARARTISWLLALLWAWVGWTFLWWRYAPINPIAAYAALAFAVEALLLARMAAGPAAPKYEAPRGGTGAVGLALVAVGIVLYPAVAPIAGRGWWEAELFGIAPDPTAIATLGLLLLVPGRLRWELLAVPVLWCLVSAATLWALGSMEALLPAFSVLLALAAATLGRPALALPRPAPEN